MRPPFELHPDTRLVTDALLRLEPGDALTYQQVGALLSRHIVGSDYTIQAARRRAEREDGFVFITERGHGLRRLHDSEIAALGDDYATKLRRAAKRNARRVANVQDYDGMTPEDRAARDGALALFGAIAAASKRSTLRRLEKAAQTEPVLSLGATFNLFKGKNNG